MHQSPPIFTRRISLAAVSLVAALGMVALATPAISAPFTPGNLIVSSAPSTTGPSPITVTEYTTGGAIVQQFIVPQGKLRGNSTTSSQINFGDVDNQLLYIATTFTNSDASSNAGYVRYNAATGMVDEFGLAPGGLANTDARGVASSGCSVFDISSSASGSPIALVKFLGGIASIPTAGNSNNRYGNFFGGNLYYTAGGGTTGLHMQSSDNTSDTTIIPSATFGSSNMSGFDVAANDAVYMCVLSGAGSGIHKLKNIAGTWTDLGTNAGILGQGIDAESVAATGTTRDLYIVGGGTSTGGNSVFKITDDTADNTPATWQSATATAFVTGMTGLRSIAVVPSPVTPPTHTVNVTTTGTGTGTVTKNPPGPNYPQCTHVTLTAVPASGSTFASWTGDVPGGTQTANPLTITADVDKNIVATFNTCSGGCKTLTLTFTGNGSVNANPPGLDFPSPGPHMITLAAGSNVSLSATPATGWVFDHYAGDATGNNPTTNVSLTADRNVTVVFKQLFQLRTFFDGNGSVTVNSPSPEGFTNTTPPNPLYRDGTVINVTANPGTIGGQQAFWTFVEFHDQSLAQLATTATANITITMNLDLTARFAEIPLNATPRPFTPGNLVTGEMRDFPPSGSKGSLIQLREYNTNGRLVQPVIDVNTAGAPAGYISSALSTLTFQIAIDPLNIQSVYIAATNIDNVTPALIGIVRNVYCGAAHVTDFSAGVQVTNNEARGVTVKGDNAFFTYDGGIRRANKNTGVVTNLPNSGNARNLEVFNGDLYVSTGGSGTPYTAGPGIYRIDNADAGTNQIYTAILATGASTSPLDFTFSDTNHLYVGLLNGGGLNGIHKFVNFGSGFVDLGQNLNLISTAGADFGRSLVTVVNGDNVALYIMASKAASDSHLVRVDQHLSDDDSDNWQFFDTPTEIVPEVSRGRGLAIVPAGCNLRGDMNGDYRVDGQDIQGYINARITNTYVQCADIDGSGMLDSTDDGLFIENLLNDGSSSISCP